MEESQSFTIGPLMKAARKFKKFNQADVATAIGCSQSALSKMEHNLLIPSAPQWFLFARFTAIPPETLESGFIDRHSKVKFNDDQVSLGFKIPKKYRSYRSQKVREIYPFLTFLEKQSDPSQCDEYILNTGLDPEFFLDFDNLINFQLMIDTIDYFIKIGKASASDIRSIVEIGQNDIYWDHYGVEWKNLESALAVLTAFSREQVFFQADFEIKVEVLDNQIWVNYYPEYHLKEMTSNLFPETIQFLNLYRKATLENLIKKVLGKTISAELVPQVSASLLAARFEISLN